MMEPSTLEISCLKGVKILELGHSLEWDRFKSLVLESFESSVYRLVYGFQSLGGPEVYLNTKD